MARLVHKSRFTNIDSGEGGTVVHSKDVIAWEQVRHSQRYVALFVWMLLGFLYFSLFGQWVTVSRRDKLFTEYIDHVIQVAANEQRPAKEVRALLLVKAEDLSLPVQGDAIQITGSGQTLRAAVHYKADISMPIVNQPVYRMRFDHDLTPKTLR
jgi:hypothetical protein